MIVSPPLVAGFDIGGTNVRCALADAVSPGAILARASSRTPADGDMGSMLAVLAGTLQDCLDEAKRAPGDVRAVGCTAPGITNAEAGIVIDAANLPGWKNLPLAAILADHFGCPAVVENDVNAAAMGEYAMGAGRGQRSVVYLTISTGVAAGIVVDGRLLRGAHHAAGELGYFLPEPAHIGKDWSPSGCLELTSAGIGIAQAWAARRGGEATPDRAVEAFAAAAAGDAQAEALIARATDYLTLACVAIGTLIDPNVLILGGSIALHQPRVFRRIQEVVTSSLLFPPAVVRAALGGDAPLIGALTLAGQLAG